MRCTPGSIGSMNPLPVKTYWPRRVPVVHCFCAKDTVGAKVMKPSINATVLMDMNPPSCLSRASNPVHGERRHRPERYPELVLGGQCRLTLRLSRARNTQRSGG